MPNANIIELETSLEDCISFCQQHPQQEYSAMYLPRLTQSQQRWEKSVALSESHHVRWRTEEREELVARKQLAHALREAQRRLHRIGAVDFPATRVLYWDEELLMEEVSRMQAYLQDHASDLPFASEYLDRFERGRGTIAGENREVEDALKGYQRFIDLRREAMNDVASLIGEFRVALRRSLGKKHPEYQAIRWPFAIASDESILF